MKVQVKTNIWEDENKERLLEKLESLFEMYMWGLCLLSAGIIAYPSRWYGLGTLIIAFVGIMPILLSLKKYRKYIYSWKKETKEIIEQTK